MSRPYDREFATTGTDRAFRVSLRDSLALSGEPTTPVSTHGSSEASTCTISVLELEADPAPNMDLAQAPDKTDHAFTARILAELAAFKALHAPKPLSATFNPFIQTLPNCLVFPDISGGSTMLYPMGS